MSKLRDLAPDFFTETVEIWHDENWRPVPEGTTGADHFVAKVRGLSGAADQRVNDASFDVDQKGNTALLMGTQKKLRVQAGVVAIEGLVDAQDQPVTTMTDKAYRALPSWALNRIDNRIIALTKDVEQAEGE